MSRRPTPGKVWTAEEDVDLEEVARQAYGDSGKAGLIWGANKPRTDTLVLKGESLIIPGSVLASPMSGKQPDDLTIVVDGRELRLTSARIVRSMDTAADGWSGIMPWIPGDDPELDIATRPFGYQRTSAYIGNELQVNGHVYGVKSSLTAEGSIKTLMGFSHTIDMVDSHVRPPYERNNITLEKLAADMLYHRGITAKFLVDSGGPFARTTGHESDTVFSHLSKLATERGLLVSCTPQGDLLFHRANVNGEPVGTLTEGDSHVLEWEAEYDGRERFNVYHCISAGSEIAQPLWGQTPATTIPPRTHSEVDPRVPLSRFMSFRADDTTPGNMGVAARWRKNKQFVDALTFSLPVVGWYAPNNKLWEVNTIVTVISKTLHVPKGYNFLIRSVEFVLDSGRTSVLQLVPPQAYTGKDIGEIWT